MVPRRLVLVGLLIAFSAGCARTAMHARGTPARPPDPDRWARTACLRGEDPPELDGRAYAVARQKDLIAEREGQANPSATARLIEARATFATRCAKWRELPSVITLVSAQRSRE